MKKPRKPYRLKKRNDHGGQYAIIDKATGKSKFTSSSDKFEAEKLACVQYDQTDDNAASTKSSPRHTLPSAIPNGSPTRGT